MNNMGWFAASRSSTRRLPCHRLLVGCAPACHDQSGVFVTMAPMVSLGYPSCVVTAPACRFVLPDFVLQQLSSAGNKTAATMVLEPTYSWVSANFAMACTVSPNAFR